MWAFRPTLAISFFLVKYRRMSRYPYSRIWQSSRSLIRLDKISNTGIMTSGNVRTSSSNIKASMTSSRNSATPSKSDGRQTRERRPKEFLYAFTHSSLLCWTFDNSTGIETQRSRGELFLFIYAGTIVALRLFNATRGMLQKSNADSHRSCLCTHGLLRWLPTSNLPAARGCFDQHRSLGWEGLFGYWTQWGSCTVLQRVAGSLEPW